MTEPFLPTYDFNDIPTDEELAHETKQAQVAADPLPPIWPFPTSPSPSIADWRERNKPKPTNLWKERYEEALFKALSTPSQPVYDAWSKALANAAKSAQAQNLPEPSYVAFLHPDQCADLQSCYVPKPNMAILTGNQVGKSTMTMQEAKNKLLSGMLGKLNSTLDIIK